MTNANKIGFLSTIILIFLLPLFFLPASILPISGVKSLLLGLGVIVAFVAFLVDTMRRGSLSLPKHKLMWATVLFPVIYFLSAYLSSDRAYSLFGVNFEVGTFGYMLIVSVLFGLVSYFYTDTSKILRALGAFLLSLLVLAIFAIVKLVSGGSPVWGTFAGNMGNPLGAWTDYSIGFGLLALFSTLALSILPVKKLARTLLSIVLFVSLILVAVINFSTTWVLLLVLSVLLLVYLLTVEKKEAGQVTTWPSIVVTVVALLFVINPTISSSGGLGNTLSNALGISNVDVRPSLSTTIDISKQTLQSQALLGSGPNTFDRAWLLYKPQNVNSSAFWNVSFPFGFGFLPTQIASTGIIGSVLWLAFLVFFLLLAGRALLRLPRDEWNKFTVSLTLILSLFLWIASFLYVPSRTVLALAFIFTGLFVASARSAGIVETREINFSSKAVHNFAAVLLVIVLGVGAAGLALVVTQRTVSAYHFQRAVALSNTDGASADEVQNQVVRAAQIVPLDIYYRSLSQLGIARAQSALNATEGTQAENQQKFQTAISDSIAAAQLATNVTPENYENWVTLGTIYSSLVPSPFSVEGAYEEAQNAFKEAAKRNPTSPEIPLLQARLELNKGNVTEARQSVEASLALKQDYADAYFLLTQLELNENNISQAIKSAETGAFLSPNNAGVFFQLGLLKYTNSDWAGAKDAFNRALAILPDYANAQYYLGLTESKLSNNEVALEIFRALEKSNPDNQEVKAIIANIETGKDPLAGFAPADQSVTTRPNPPIDAQSQ